VLEYARWVILVRKRMRKSQRRGSVARLSDAVAPATIGQACLRIDLTAMISPDCRRLPLFRRIIRVGRDRSRRRRTVEAGRAPDRHPLIRTRRASFQSIQRSKGRFGRRLIYRRSCHLAREQLVLNAACHAFTLRRSTGAACFPCLPGLPVFAWGRRCLGRPTELQGRNDGGACGSDEVADKVSPCADPFPIKSGR